MRQVDIDIEAGGAKLEFWHPHYYWEVAQRGATPGRVP